DIAKLTRPTVDVLAVQYPALALQPVVERCPLDGRQDIEVGNRDFVLLKEVQGGTEGPCGLAVPAKDEIQGIADAAPAEVGQHFSVARGLVKPLVHALQRLGIEALDADV